MYQHTHQDISRLKLIQQPGNLTTLCYYCLPSGLTSITCDERYIHVAANQSYIESSLSCVLYGAL